MAISDNQKIDYLFKKVGFGATKTDTVFNKLAANESLPSPLLIRGDTIWAESGNIPSVIPTTSTAPVEIRTAIETTEDITATGNRTWKTGITDWIPTEFGATYLVNVYVHTSGDPAGAESISNKVFTTGSGNNDEWFFDYQSGVLNFIGENLPNGVDFSGKSVYISGATYSGARGVASAAITADISDLQSQVDNILTNTDPATLDSLSEIVTAFQQGDIELELTVGDGTTSVSDTTNVVFDPNSGFTVTDNGNGQVTVTSDVSGQVASDLANLEAVLRSDFTTPVLQYPTSQVFTGDGTTVNYTLSETIPNAHAIDVYVNDVLQRPSEAYQVIGTTLQMLSVPDAGMDIYVKYRTSFSTTNAIPTNTINSTHIAIDQVNGSHIADDTITNDHLNLTYSSNQYTADGVQVAFNIQDGHTVDSVLVIKNGLILTPQDYHISGTTLTILSTPAASDVIDIRYLPI
jgi:hypothetical protein